MEGPWAGKGFDGLRRDKLVARRLTALSRGFLAQATFSERRNPRPPEIFFREASHGVQQVHAKGTGCSSRRRAA